ncbi:MAG: head-tail connector protein [Clostridium sp.]|nr:head-tail connector protein [Clostridium sp.]
MTLENKVREWIRLEEGDDMTVSSLIITSRAIIKKSTGITEEECKSEETKSLYETIQKILVNRLYENRESNKEIDHGLVGMYVALRTLVEEENEL